MAQKFTRKQRRDELNQVFRSPLDWDIIGDPGSTLGPSFVFVGVLLGFTLAAYLYSSTKYQYVNMKSNFLLSILSFEVVEVLLLDFLACISTGVTLALQKALCANLVTAKQCKAAQLVWEFLFAIIFILTGTKRNWAWHCYVFFTPHVITLLMKQHSYYVENSKLFAKNNKNNLRRSKKLVYPNNLNVLNYVQFMFSPKLIYELSYPKTKSIRAIFLVSKLLMMLACIVVLYIGIEYIVAPLLAYSQDIPLLAGILLLSVPVVLGHMILFYLIFETMLNLLAEITRHSDRNFYGHWWASGNFESFFRSWNKLVHNFLKTYVYDELRKLKFSNGLCLLATFTISAFFHELIMFTICGKLKLYIFTTIMILAPLIWIEKKNFVRIPHLLNILKYWVLFFSVRIFQILLISSTFRFFALFTIDQQ